MRHFIGLLATLLVATAHPARAHEATDWRRDARAYASVRVDPPLNYTLSLLLRLRAAAMPVDPAFLQAKLREFVDFTIERRSEGGRERARQFLAREYQALGFAVQSAPYRGGANFVAERTGRDPSKVLILSAHLDSVGNAGANDDGIGVIAGLAIARGLVGRDLAYTVRFVGFDQEEIGLVGSGQYVRSLSGGPQIIGDIQLEMMATNRRKDGAFHLIDCDRPESAFLTHHIVAAIQALALPLKRVTACTDRSDHASFWRAKLPAVVLSENFFGGDSDPCYHRACDVLDARLDFAYAANITRAVGTATAAILGARR